MKKILCVLSAFLAMVIFPLANTLAAPPSPANWSNLVSAAQKEGKVVITGESIAPVRDPIIQAFKAKYGIDVEIVSGRGAEMVAKFAAERQAGLYLRDVGLMGVSTIVVEIKPLGAMVPLDNMILPDMRDGSKWRGGELPFIDKEHSAVVLTSMAFPCMVINTALVHAGDIKRHTDLLQPKWKGKIVLLDPSTSGPGNNWFTHIVTNVYGQEKGLQFMRSLAKQDVMVTRDTRLQVEWVAKGKYSVGLGFSMVLATPFKKAGAPIDYPALAEPSYLGGASGNLFVFDKAPHPNAAKLLVNWLMSQDGNKVFATALGLPSLRLDVPSDYVEAFLVPPRDANFRGQDDYVFAREKLRKTAAEIFN